MKWYSHPTYKSHLKSMKFYNRTDAIKAPYIEWPKSMANMFERSYPRIGVLDLTDLLQEGYCSFYKAWEKLNWDIINKAEVKDQPAVITNYLKLNIKNGIRRAIARDRDTIRIPEAYYTDKPHGDAHGGKYDKNYQADIFLTRTFSSFFNDHYLDIANDVSSYDNDLLNDFLNTVMNKYLTPTEKDILCRYFGIDEPYDKKVSVARIAASINKSEIWVKKKKAQALKKLQTEEVKEIIKNYLQE
tara:strand:- start:6023 stop:6754 length:732 start_codon:yes stop_codon:yes gene_type:complete